MVDSQEAAKWMAKAKEDYAFSSSVLPETTFYAQVNFFFQQAAEKFLKAYIVAHGLEFKKIHDLTELLAICNKHTPSFSQLFDDCVFLNAFYIEPRYPVHWPAAISKEEALKAQEAAQHIKDFVENILQA